MDSTEIYRTGKFYIIRLTLICCILILFLYLTLWMGGMIGPLEGLLIILPFLAVWLWAALTTFKYPVVGEESITFYNVVFVNKWQEVRYDDLVSAKLYKNKGAPVMICYLKGRSFSKSVSLGAMSTKSMEAFAEDLWSHGVSLEYDGRNPNEESESLEEQKTIHRNDMKMLISLVAAILIIFAIVMVFRYQL